MLPLTQCDQPVPSSLAGSSGGAISGNVARPQEKPTTLRFVISALTAGLLLTVGLHIPLAGSLFALLAFPVFWVFPEFASLGTDVGYHLGTLFLQSPKSWVAFLAYFTLLAAAASLIFLPRPAKSK